MIKEITVLNVVPLDMIAGPTQRILQVAKGLKLHGMRTIVVMPTGDRGFSKLLNEAGIASYQLGSFKKLPPPANLFAVFIWLCCFFPCVFSLIKLIRKESVDIVQVNGSLNVQVALAAKLSGTKLVWYLNDILSPRLLKPVILPLFYTWPDRIVGAAEFVRHIFLGNGRLAKRMTVLYPPIDTAMFRPLNASATVGCKERLGFKADDTVVGIVGNINPDKGYEYFFPAVKIVKDSVPHAKFLVVGRVLETQEKYWQCLSAMIADLQIKDSVIMAGFQSNISDVMNALDIFVLASVREAAPIVVMEAMACARPVVATRVGGVPELVTDGETGVLVPARDPEALAEAVIDLLNNLEKNLGMGAKGRSRVEEFFDLSTCIQKHEQLYRSIT